MSKAKPTRQDVAAFYQRHPYPPPTQSLDDFREGHITETPSPAFYAPLLWPTGRPQKPQVLVAGCGTAQAAKLAIQNPECEIFGVDISEASLAASAQLAERYQLDNLSLRNHPIEALPELGQDFDLIISTGVLHHLPDPDAGLRALRQVIRPGGALHLKVYAPYGRAGVYMMQEYCRLLGVAPDEAEITALIKLTHTLPDHHPLGVFQRNTPDLTTIGGTADALLHPQDRAYSVPQLMDWLQICDWRFDRWFFQAPYRADCSRWRDSSHGEQLAKLNLADQAAAMELLRADQFMHEVIARPSAPEQQAPSPQDDAWLDYRAHPMPGIRINQLGIPQGYQGQLWHPAHRSEDIRLNLTDNEMALFQLIDGQRKARDLVNAMSAVWKSKSAERVRALLDALWRYDALMISTA